MLLKLFTSSIKVENVVESARMSVKVELVLFEGVGVAQLQDLKKILNKDSKQKKRFLPGLTW